MKTWEEFLEDKNDIVEQARKIGFLGAIKKKGRCKDMGSSECPGVRPQYRLV